MNRRDFIKKAIAATAGITLAPLVPKANPESAAKILSTKDFVEFVPLYDIWDKKFDRAPILFYANMYIQHKGERLRMDSLF